MSFIKASGLGALTSSNTATIVDPQTPASGSAILSPLVSFASVASTSGTSIDFTGIPSWAKRITVMFDGVSTSGTSLILIQIGDSGGIETTGYNSSGVYIVTTPVVNLSTAGFNISGSIAAARLISGSSTISLVASSTNTWACSGSYGTDIAAVFVHGGSKSLSATLDRVRITTVNGTDTFDAGSINVLYE